MGVFLTDKEPLILFTQVSCSPRSPQLSESDGDLRSVEEAILQHFLPAFHLPAFHLSLHLKEVLA